MISYLKNNTIIVFLIALIASVIFIPFLGHCPLFDWDEINFAECAREMIISQNYSQPQINYQPFWEKPPFFIWLQAISMNLFGINEFAARFPNSICCIISLISIYLIGEKFHSKKFGILWALIYTATLLPHFYFKSGIIDPWFNLFIFLALYNCFLFIDNLISSNYKNIFLAGFFLGLAVLTKGPVALIISSLTILLYLFWQKKLKTIFKIKFIVFILITLLISGSWFILEYLNGNKKIIFEFIDYQIRLFKTEDSGHSGPFFYHFIILLIGCFPASFIFISSYLNYKDLTQFQKNYRKLSICLFWVVLILFSIVKTKIIHYSSLCYFPITFIATIGIIQNIQFLKFNFLSKITYWFIASLIAIAFTFIGLIDYFKKYIISNGFIKDEFAIQNLQAKVNWAGYEFIIGLVFFIASFFIYKSIQTKNLKLFYIGCCLNIIFISSSIIIIVPKIELYTQHATIEFYKKCAKQNCYVETKGFKSYAYLFYSNRLISDYNNHNQIVSINNTLNLNEKVGFSRTKNYSMANSFWIQTGKIDKPAYLVIKTINEAELLIDPKQKKLYSKNGYSFFVRFPEKTDK